MPQIFRMGEYWIYFWTNETRTYRKRKAFRKCNKGMDYQRRELSALQ